MSRAQTAQPQSVCSQPVYLTFDTGHMGVAPFVADVLAKHAVKVTFFLANEKTKTDGTSLDDVWQPWWQARAREGHAFGSHTFDHVYWLADSKKGFRVKASAGKALGQVFDWTPEQYCAQARRSGARFTQMTGRPLSTQAGRVLFRAPGGKTSPKLLEALRACGFEPIGWSAAGFLGDELPSEKYPNAVLLDKALQNIRSGDVLLAHLGIWSRKEPWALAALEPLIVGLKERGFCFQTLAQ
ncbi:MAG: polysaccharide deacetylase family protein [Cytophagales bacterium]|nr:polysaccharide deacetylase family protein [Cytophagales bacterium]